MDDRAVSSVVAVMLLLAVLATSASVFMVNYYPVLAKKTEIAQAEKLKEDFLETASLCEGGEIILRLGGDETPLTRRVIGAAIRVKESGKVDVSISNANNSIVERITLFHVNLSTHSTMIPDQTLTCSQRGIIISQYNVSLVKNPPVIDLTYDNSTNTLKFTVDSLASGNETISGNGVVVLSIRGSAVKREFSNANVSLSVEDGIFMDYWHERFDELIAESPDVFAFADYTFYTKFPVNTVYIRRDVTVSLN